MVRTDPVDPERDHIGVALIDLDDFKHVNDSAGHSIGDQVLRDVAKRLDARKIGHATAAARLGGDEFALVFRLTHADLVSGDAVTTFAALAPRPALVPNATSLSIGLATAPAPLADLGALLGRADAAMYRAKRAGGGRVEAYQPELDQCAASPVRPQFRARDRRSRTVNAGPDG